MSLDLSICLVNYNAKTMLLNCLRSIYEYSDKISFEIIIVDNNSTDDSIQSVRRLYPKINIIENKKNMGFASANNQAIKISVGRYILLLNNDTELINNAFSMMIPFMDQKPEIGLLTCKLYESDKSAINPNCRSFPLSPISSMFARESLLSKLFPNNSFTTRYMLSEWNYNSRREVDWISGACMLIRRELIDEIGILDDNYFMYWEDVDYCKRARSAGRRVFFIPEAELIHHAAKGGGGRGLGLKIYLIYQMHHSAYYYFIKHHYYSPFHPLAIILFMGMLLLVCVKSTFELLKYIMNKIRNIIWKK